MDAREEYNVGIGRRLAAIRKARGLTQRQAAAFMGLPANTLCGYERGRYMLPYSLLSVMVQLYGVSYDTVLELRRPLPPHLRACLAGTADPLEWRIHRMLAEYESTGRFYLLCCGPPPACWVRHDPASPGTVLLSALRPGEPEPPSRRFPAEAFAQYQPGEIAAILRQL